MPEADSENGSGLPIGGYLKSVRQSKGLELDEASRVTKISKNYLVALEEGEFDRLPSPAYIKGFLRLYAAYLSLSGDEVVARYEGSHPSARPAAEPPPQRPVEIMERSKVAGPSRWVIPSVLLALVIVAAVFFSDGDERPARQAASPAPQQSAAPAPAPAPPATAAVMPPRSSAATAAQAQGEALPPVVPSREGGVVLRLRFNRDSGLGITIDDAISQHYDLKAGDVIEWKGAKSFQLDLGDGGAVEGDFNGRPLKALGEAGKPAHVELKSP